MKLNRFIMIAILTVVLAICTGILLSGCASIGDGKDAEPKQETSRQIDNRSTAPTQASGSNPAVQKKPVVYTGGSGEKPHVQAANPSADKEKFMLNATYLKQALDRILPATLPEMNWNRVATVLAGILVISMIYGLAFGLGRLPARRRGAGRRGGGQQTGEHAKGSVSH
ncbi:MAG: hypothetical protein JSV89_20925 [Spirochaetaceae bacterium]|nr:MAG: hypothetical protein JSV89_20925 [Spirochaetaceae bacterium]